MTKEMMKDFAAKDSLLGLLPPVNRARGFRLYTAGGKRFTDLWLCGGAALLGHNPPQVLRELKNAGERGLFAPLPHLRENRLVKALSRFFPRREIRLYADEGSLRRALRALGVRGAEDPLGDPAFEGDTAGAPAALSRWRPFLPEPASPWLVPVLPWPLSPQALVFPPEGSGSLAPEDGAGDRISAVILAAVARSVHDLAAAEGRGAVKFPRVERALAQSGSPWERRGIYLSLKEAVPPEAPEPYGELFRRFLAAGFLLPPEPAAPLILPGALSPGEEAKLAGLLES